MHVAAEYGRSFAGRSSGRSLVFLRQVRDIEFKYGPTGFSPTGGSRANFEYVTAQWEKDQGETCFH